MGERKRRRDLEGLTKRDLNRAYRQVLSAVPGGRAGDGPNAVATPCLGCGAILDSGTLLGDKLKDVRPTPGSISICWKCGHLQAYAADLTFRPLTDAEMIEVAGDPRILLANAIREPVRKLNRDEKERFMTKLEREAELEAVIDAVIAQARRNADGRKR
jgi:hypothetical protein